MKVSSDAGDFDITVKDATVEGDFVVITGSFINLADHFTL